jgi:hypothetical protein
MPLRGVPAAVAVALLLVVGAGCSDDDGGGDEASATTEETTSTTAASTTTTQDPGNWCSAFSGFATFVSAAVNSGNPAGQAAAFEEQADALRANAPSDELEELLDQAVESSQPAFDGSAPSQEQLDQQSEALAGIREACGFE